MATEYGLDLIPKMYDTLNSKDLDAHDNYWHNDMIRHGPDGLTGTHKGTWMGVEPTGKPMRMRFSDFWRIRDGKRKTKQWCQKLPVSWEAPWSRGT